MKNPIKRIIGNDGHEFSDLLDYHVNCNCNLPHSKRMSYPRVEGTGFAYNYFMPEVSGNIVDGSISGHWELWKFFNN